MLKMSRLTDYGTVVLAHLDGKQSKHLSAAEIARSSGIALPTVSKILKMLAKAGLVSSIRGVLGGYRLDKLADQISIAEVIEALEGPVSITECSAVDRHCEYASNCLVSHGWQRINVAIRRALDDVSLADLQRVNSPVPVISLASLRVNSERGS